MIEVMFSTDKCSDRKQVISRNKLKKGQFVWFDFKTYANNFADEEKQKDQTKSSGYSVVVVNSDAMGIHWSTIC